MDYPFMPNGSTATAKLIRVEIKERDGLFIARSPDLRGLLIAKRDAAAVRLAIPDVITELFNADGADVIVAPIEAEHGHLEPWVAMPVAVARDALKGRADV